MSHDSPVVMRAPANLCESPGTRRSKMNRNTSCATCSKRETSHRIFVNRSLHLERIRFYGFDMDYTLAMYASPFYEQLAFDLCKSKLVDIGYPNDILQYNYDATFSTRGVWFDQLYGNLLKVDEVGLVILGRRGFQGLSDAEIDSLYPNRYVAADDRRFFVLNTLFDLPMTYLLASVVDYFSNGGKVRQSGTTETAAWADGGNGKAASAPREFVLQQTGVTSGSVFMSYRSIFQDVRDAFEFVHAQGSLKRKTLEKMEKYVVRDERLPILLDRLRSTGAKTFLLTNSEYYYTDAIMGFILRNDSKRDWASYFDYVFVDAHKPLFFEAGTVLREVDRATGRSHIGMHVGPLKTGEVYCGGSLEIFQQMTGSTGEDVLFTGDHIFGDILKSKRKACWRTFLVIPELVQELHVWTGRSGMFEELLDLEGAMSDIYHNLDSNSRQKPDVASLCHRITETTAKMDAEYGQLGSMFRIGNRHTYFAYQAMRYADIYSYTPLNLLHYPFCYFFRAQPTLMPHEATVEPEFDEKLDTLLRGGRRVVNRTKSIMESPEESNATH